MSLPPDPNHAPSTFLKRTRSTNVYVETGIWRGDSLQYAIDAGFRRVIGIENDPSSIEFCKSRFGVDVAKIDLVQGDSALVLWDVIKNIDEPITFFLDSHWQMLEGTEPGANPFPLLDELRQIARHKWAMHHKVIIDDWHIFYPDRVGYSKDDIRNALRNMGLTNQQLVANPVIDGLMIATS